MPQGALYKGLQGLYRKPNSAALCVHVLWFASPDGETKLCFTGNAGSSSHPWVAGTFLWVLMMIIS